MLQGQDREDSANRKRRRGGSQNNTQGTDPGTDPNMNIDLESLATVPSAP